MIRKIGAENMRAAFSSGDEVEIPVLFRAGGRAQAGQTWRADRTGGKTGPFIGIVNVVRVVKMSAFQVAVEAFPDAVGRGRVSLKQHAQSQPVGVHSGYRGAFRGN